MESDLGHSLGVIFRLELDDVNDGDVVRLRDDALHLPGPRFPPRGRRIRIGHTAIPHQRDIIPMGGGHLDLGSLDLPIVEAAPATPVGVDPRLPELLPVQVVNEEVRGRVEADEEVGEPHDDIHHRDFAHGAVVAEVAVVAAHDQLVQVRNDLKGLTEDEKR